MAKQATKKKWSVNEVSLIVIDGPDGEELFTLRGPRGEVLPVVAVNDDGVGILSENAQEASNAINREVRILSFTRRGVREIFRPRVSNG